MREKFKPKIEYKEKTEQIVRQEKEELEKNSEHSSVKKTIGITEQEKEELKKEFARRFTHQEFLYQKIPELKEKEIEKTPDQIEIIKFINNETNKLLEKYGLPKFDISPDNVHFLRKDNYEEIFKETKKEGAYFSPHYQSVFIKETASILKFTKRCFHEFVHFKAYQTVQIVDYRKAKLYQSGIHVDTKSKGECFKNLNEAITEKLSKIVFYKNALKNPKLPESLKKEIAETEKEKKLLLATIKDEKEREKINDIFLYSVTSFSLPDGRKKYKSTTETFTYFRERKILNIIVRKLYNRNKDKFKNEDEVFDLFARSAFTGKLSWGRLVNQTFGKGTFKKLAQSDKNVEKLEKFVKDL